MTLPALPTTYQAEPGPTCESDDAIYPDGSRRPIVIPPAPGLRAVAVTKHTTRIEWWFDELPDDCRPDEMLLSVVAGTDVNATPTTQRVSFTERRGAPSSSIRTSSLRPMSLA